MNTFQILDKDGHPIPIGTLDKEVCILTGNEEERDIIADLEIEKTTKLKWILSLVPIIGMIL